VLVKLVAMTHAIVSPEKHLNLRSRSSALRIGLLHSPSKRCVSINYTCTTPVTSEISGERKVADGGEATRIVLDLRDYFSVKFLDLVL
jgi:hypothetical protein